MAKRVVSANGKAKSIVEEKGNERTGMDSPTDNGSSNGDGNKATLKDWLIVGGTILVIVLLLSSCVRSCRGGKKESAANQQEENSVEVAPQDESMEDDVEEESVNGIPKSAAVGFFDSFYAAYNQVAEIALGKTIAIDDLTEEELNWFEKQAGEDWYILVQRDGYVGEKFLLTVFQENGTTRCGVCAFFSGKSSDIRAELVDPFRTTYLLLSDDATEDGFGALRNGLVFSGEEGIQGESEGVSYRLDVFDDCRAFYMAADIDDLNVIADGSGKLNKQVAALDDTLYEEDGLINEFLIAYNNNSSSPIKDVDRGNHRAKVYGHTYDRQIEVLDASNDQIKVYVNATFEQQDMADLKEAFRDVVTTLDTKISDEEAYSTYDACLNSDSLKVEGEIGTVSYMFIPSHKLSESIYTGHFEVSLPL